jgi:environmental stress-induced protein Ves
MPGPSPIADDWRVIRLQDVAQAPWRNGGGVTRELLAWPQADDWTMRLSVAEVAAAGPFSSFPGVQRWFAVLAGAGVRLRIEGQVHELGPASPPLQFEGAADTACELLAGPTTDFNLMLRGGSGSMQRVHGVHASSCKAGTFVALYVHGGAGSVSTEAERSAVAADALAWRVLEADTLVQVTAGAGLWIEVLP